jgi:NAD(P)-dependent dehydrogenase (short-subunit alcohol dehydrogenase family)
MPAPVPREHETLALMTQGYSNAAIAAMLVATEVTVAKHIRNIEHGFRTILTARDPEQGRAAADALDAEFVQLDVAHDASVDRCFRTVEERHGRLDVLVNNAAIDYDTWQGGVDADLTVVHQAFETNLFGAWRCCLRAVPPHGAQCVGPHRQRLE